MRARTLALVVLLAPVAAWAQTPAAEVPVVVTAGEGVVKRAPDRAWVTIAAETRATTPEEAQRLNAEAMSAVLQKLKGAGLGGDAIRTTGYDLQPEFDFANNRRTLRGYVARNSVEVRVDDLPKLGAILQVAVGAGATNVSGVRFDLKNREEAERQALKLAVEDARQRADAAAAGAGLKVERILRIQEHGDVSVPPPPRPLMREAMAMQGPGEPPMSEGEIEVRASVTLTASLK